MFIIDGFIPLSAQILFYYPASATLDQKQ